VGTTASASVSQPRLILVLGDQLSDNNPVLRGAVAGKDHVLLAEVAEEANYVRHNRHKLVLIFAAMRRFAGSLREQGFTVHYFSYAQAIDSLSSAVETVLATAEFAAVDVCEPGEYRVLKSLQAMAQSTGLPVNIHPDTRFLCQLDEFAEWASGRKQLRMEYFYRLMRQRYQLLLQDDGEPEGGRWNYDRENRKGWRAAEAVPERPVVAMDEITAAVIAEVMDAFPDNPGDLSQFCYATDAATAQQQLDWFCEHALARFGTWQDGLAEESPWMFHSIISMYMNIGLLDPLQVCQQVEAQWRAGKCELAAAEGFIRQVLGWREYVRGIYWLHMPAYGKLNHFDAHTPLPDWFWTGETDMRCLSRALKQSLELGYAHHIQRLMVIGNFALLAGLDVEEVCEWYLAVYTDAFEWVELPNTAGMALFADGGIMASKPYAASGSYLKRQGNHCAACRYDPGQVTGSAACPYNALYWRFIDRHRAGLEKNGRMGLVLANWKRRSPADRHAIVEYAELSLPRILASDKD
jgi:deoxyribodipyrimidine photolyase-related protein